MGLDLPVCLEMDNRGVSERELESIRGWYFLARTRKGASTVNSSMTSMIRRERNVVEELQMLGKGQHCPYILDIARKTNNLSP